MKTVVTLPEKNSRISPGDMAVGQLGLIHDLKPDKPEIVLCTFTGLVSLDDPSRTWSRPYNTGCLENKIELLPEGTKITITI